MLNIELGKLDYSVVSAGQVKLFTGNSQKVAGKLVMGKGAALDVKQNYLGIDRVFGRIIEADSDYLLCILSEYGIGAFQVKRRFNSKASYVMIERSARMLCDLARGRPFMTYHCNFPGVGAGGLKYDDVEGVLQSVGFGDNVVFYYDEN